MEERAIERFIECGDPHHGFARIYSTGVPAALANAVYHATGVRVRALPITLDKLLAG